MSRKRDYQNLELEIKKLRDLKSHLEHETKVLEVKNSDLREKIEKQDDEIDLWRTYAEGLEARVEIAKRRESKKVKDNLAPMMLGVLGAAVGSYIGASAAKKPS